MLDESLPVAELVLEHPELAPVLQRHHIDSCCRGDVPLAEAARTRGLDLSALRTELTEALGGPGTGELDPRCLSTTALVAHIVERYHEPLRRSLPYLLSLAQKVAGVHGTREPRFGELAVIVEELADELTSHLDEEETTLFPLLLAGTPQGVDLEDALRETLSEHLALALLLDRIRAATDDHHVPEWACTSVTTLMRKLHEMEGELLRHVHLENHVLALRFAGP